MRRISSIILHCSATWSKQDIGAKEIRKAHLANGWADIGYHYVIRRDGTIEKGRPLEKAGAHCSGYNANSIGICVVGGGPYGEDKYFTKAQFDSLAKLINDLRAEFPDTIIMGHNELNKNKACPVFSVPKFLTDYRINKRSQELA